MTTKIKPKLILANVLFGNVENCGLFPTISRVGVYGIILYLLLFNFQDKIRILVYFSSLVTFVELCWCRLDFCKRLIWHFLSLVILLSFLFLILSQTNPYWNKAYAIENGISGIIRDAPSGIIAADKYGIIKEMNLNAENITGWKKSELVGSPISKLIAPDKVERHDRAFMSIVKRIEENKKSEAFWVFTNELNHSFNIVTKYGYNKSVKLYVLAVPFSNYHQNYTNIDFYAIIETD